MNSRVFRGSATTDAVPSLAVVPGLSYRIWGRRQPGRFGEINGCFKNAGGFTPGAGSAGGSHSDAGASGARPGAAARAPARLDDGIEAQRPASRQQEQEQGIGGSVAAPKIALPALGSDRLIVALDVETAVEARVLIAALGDAAGFYKVGLEMFASAGMDFVRELKAQGHRVFVDLKLYDIGETVKRAVAQVAKVGADFLTVHGSRAVMAAAVAGRGDSSLKLLAVTVLTSFDESDLRQMGYSCDLPTLVELRVRNAMDAGIDGVVCSPLEAARVRAIAGPRATLVTPGVRSAGASVGDQKRIATPAEAIANGADYLVIGRQVTRSSDPRGEFLKICDEIAAKAE